MALTEEEGRRLHELATGLSREDPKLARELSDPKASSRTSWHGYAVCGWAAVVLFAVGMPLLILAVIVQQPLLFVFGCCALVAASAVHVGHQIANGRGGTSP